MEFGTDYWNSLDKAKELRIDPHEIGISHGIGEVGEGLKANIFRGASLVELGFFGQGKGFRSQPTGHTPESYGKTEREEMRQLAKINEVELTTHASPNIGPVSGYAENAFRPEQAENVLHEVERAISFAGDVTQGGPVVVHVGEFPREVFRADEKFEHYPEEQKKAQIRFVDERTGAIMGADRMQQFPVPEYTDEKETTPKRDEHGNIIWTNKNIAELEKEAQKKGIPVGNYIMEFVQKRDKELMDFEQRRYRREADEADDTYKELNSKIESLKEMKDKENREYMARVYLERRRLVPDPESEEYNKFLEDPVSLVEDRAKRLKETTEFYREAEFSYGRQKAEIENRIGNVKPLEEYGLQKAADTLSRAAMYAYEVEKKKNLEKPLFIAPENWTPELYGSHPQELKAIIQKSREEMARKLTDQKQISESEAKKIADEHIKATVDIGHLNFWRKYFKGTDEEFRTWIDDQVKDLTKKGIIGHVHLSDNFGYHDEHLAPGEGNAPIQKFVERLKESGFKGKLIGEPGGQKEGFYHEAWLGSMRTLGSPIYRIDSQSLSWTDIEHSYFGKAPQSPYFLVGDIVPSKDWTLWSEVPME